ncbi:MAG: amino acid-binding protein [Planctomycetota bacterium]
MFLANKPALLAQVCQRLADDHVNILALSMMDATEHGVLRFVAEDAGRARRSLAAANVPTTESTVLLAMLPNRPGALADVVRRLAINHITLNYAYLSTGASGGKTIGVFRVSDLRKAARVLGERRPQRREALAAPRPRRTHA